MLNYLLCQLTAVQADGFGQVTKLLCGGTWCIEAQCSTTCCASLLLCKLLGLCLLCVWGAVEPLSYIISKSH